MENQRRPDGRRAAGRRARRRPASSASCEVDAESRVVGFEEKPQQPKPIPGDPQPRAGLDGHLRLHRPVPLRAALPRRHAARQPARLRPRHHSRRSSTRTACSPIPFMDENRKKDAYWRDVGTLDAYYEANMDLISVDPQLNMYDGDWPIRTYQPNLPPPKFVFAEERPERPARPGARQHRLPGLHRLRRPGGAVDRRARLAHQQLRPGGRFDPLRGRRTSAATPRSAGRSSTRASTFPPASRSATTTSWTAAAASPSPSRA